jgi:biopolymer transport protein ExbB
MSGLFVLGTNTASAVTLVQDDAAAKGFTQVLKEQFIQGGASFMGIVLLCLILGLAVAIERIIFLNLATTNTTKLKEAVEAALKSGGVNAAKEICRDTKGPVASIYYQGLDRAGESIESAEKAVVAYGGVQMGQLEKNVSWLSLFIAIAPMLGFMGTVIGMIQAFQKIAAVGNLSASLIAGDIQVALLTTVFGLITAIILQIFYNYIIAKIDGIVNDMEDSSIALIDMLVDHKK